MSHCFPEEASYLAKSFDCMQTIVRGGSTVYKVVCTRGRLRGRILALKKVSRLSKVLSSSVSATPLHQTLHHPNIESLYSISSALSSDYYVLEFCSEGNLSDLLSSRNPSILSETELRRVLKGIGSALVYLKEERVIHRNVCPSTILFAEDSKPKLSDFEQAVRLPQEDGVIFGVYEMATYPAPELLPSSRSAYDFAVDTWSLGCTAQLCVHGKCHAGGGEPQLSPLEGDRNPNLQDLLTRLLKIHHAHRMDASQILKHPFITDDPAQPPKIPGALGILQSDEPERLTSKGGPSLHPPRSSARDQNTNDQSRPTPTFPMHFNHLDRRRLILSDISNRDMRKSNLRNRSLPARRVASDPISFKSPYCTIAEEKPINSGSTFEPGASLTKQKSTLLTEVLPATYDIAIPFQNSIVRDERSQSPMQSLKWSKSLNKIYRIPSLPPANNTPPLPIGTARPQPINTSLLAPKTYKLATGNLTILPSRSLLVDFRENQRRQGQRGDEVLLIDSTGTSVKVFCAPHLSVPTCLVEPTNEYTIDTLPSSYWKLYNHVYDLIRQIKQRTPQLTMNTDEAKCTLMANSPTGDIELLLNRDSFSYKGSTSVGLKGKDRLPSMRIRFSRQQCFLEFAQHVVGPRGSEWKKRVKAFTGNFGLLLEDDLSDLERKAVHLLIDFLQTCQKLEQLSALDITGKVLNSADDCSVLQKLDDCTSVRTLASLKVHKGGTNLGYLKHGSDHGAPIVKDVFSQPSALTLEVKFIHSTGWCIKHINKVSSKAVYTMLFLDGSTVAIDGSQVEFTSPSGDVSRCRIFESYSSEEVGQRMKFFDDFVRLFDSSD